jgi:hypothetical protein
MGADGVQHQGIDAKTLGKALIPFQKKKVSHSEIWGFGGGFLVIVSLFAMQKDLCF